MIRVSGSDQPGNMESDSSTVATLEWRAAAALLETFRSILAPAQEAMETWQRRQAKRKSSSTVKKMMLGSLVRV